MSSEELHEGGNGRGALAGGSRSVSMLVRRRTASTSSGSARAWVLRMRFGRHWSGGSRAKLLRVDQRFASEGWSRWPEGWSPSNGIGVEESGDDEPEAPYLWHPGPSSEMG
jgi:hypothetical protein